MTKIVIIGATGSVGRVARWLFLAPEPATGRSEEKMLGQFGVWQK